VWHVYHVSARPIYRLLGDPESQNRRSKGDAQVRARLIAPVAIRCTAK
jgi:hypothetical protein